MSNLDARLFLSKQPAANFMSAAGFAFLIEGENDDYFAEKLLLLPQIAATRYREAALECYQILVEAAQYVAKNGFWKEAGIPREAIELVKFSMENELALHAIGRFDFSGGLADNAIKMLEFNADTFSLLAETSVVQPHILQQTDRSFRPFLAGVEGLLIEQFRRTLRQNPQKEPTLLVTWMGHEEDRATLEPIARAAKQAGFEQVQFMLLERIVFSEDEGIFIDLGNENFRQFDFLFKMAPWDFIAYDEPDLMRILTKIVKNGLATIINPACAMLLQSKGLLPFAHQLRPNSPFLLKTTLRASEFPDQRFAEKPVFGRVGDNVKIFNGSSRAEQSNDGDYGALPKVFQALAPLEMDSEGYRYQPSIYWAGGDAAGFCVRRQEDWIIDDDAEFVATGMLG